MDTFCFDTHPTEEAITFGRISAFSHFPPRAMRRRRFRPCRLSPLKEDDDDDDDQSSISVNALARLR